MFLRSSFSQKASNGLYLSCIYANVIHCKMPKDPNLQQQKNCHMQKSRHNTEKISLLVYRIQELVTDLFTHTHTHTHIW